MHYNKKLVCKLIRLVPKVKLGPFEWETPELIRDILNCQGVNEKTVCYPDVYGKSVCILPQIEMHKNSRLLMP